MPASPHDYVELRARSAFSFLEGASEPEQLAQRASELDYPALALADQGGVYGLPRFHQATQSVGIRGMLGAEVELDDPKGGALLVLVESTHGWRGLSRLITDGQAHPEKSICRVNWEQIEEHARDWTVLIRGDDRMRPEILDRARGVIGPDSERLWVDVSRSLDRFNEHITRQAIHIAEKMKVPIVATGDVRSAHPRGRALLDALTCLKNKTTLDHAGRLLLPNAERSLQRREQIVERFSD